MSAMAQLGRLVFFDPTLSSSGALSCASCHSPQHAYGPPADLAVPAGVRAVPSLMYLERQPNFSIGPDDAENEAAPSPLSSNAPALAVKSAQNTAQSAQNLVPQGGLFWDGRVNTLQSQALEPLLNPLEMDGGSVGRVAAKLRRAPYAARLRAAVRPADLRSREHGGGRGAVRRRALPDRGSRRSIRIRANTMRGSRARRASQPAEARGYALFRDPNGANCAACHLDRPDANGLPPLFTDHQFEALGVPRNPTLAGKPQSAATSISASAVRSAPT